MATYAANTEVSQEKSRAEIEMTLRRYGADAFSYGWEEAKAIIVFRASGRQVRFEISLPERGEERFKKYKRGHSWFSRTPEAAIKEWEQACRQKWRALALVIKAKLEAVDAGISIFEEEFLANILLPNGDTVYKQIAPHIQQAYDSGQMPKRLLLGAFGGEESNG